MAYNAAYQVHNQETSRRTSLPASTITRSFNPLGMVRVQRAIKLMNTGLSRRLRGGTFRRI